MKVNFKKIFIYTLLIVFLIPSCNYLNLEPEDEVTRDKFWKTKEEVESAVMGCYAAMMNYDAMLRYFLWGEIRADLVVTTVRANEALINIKNGDLSPTDGFNAWGSIYAVINNCNTVLEFAKETKKIDQSFSEDLLLQYEAEVTAIRSLMYFYLVRTFGDVPYITEASLSDSQNYSVPKSTQKEIIEELIKSLKSIDRTQNGTNKGIPFGYGTNPAANKGRFTVWGVKALLADIYLWNEDYEKCISETNQIINSGQFSLVQIKSNLENVDFNGEVRTVYYPSEADADIFFTSMYVNGNSVESIFELQFSTDYENPFYDYFSSRTGRIAANTEVLSNLELFMPSSVDKGWYDTRGEGVSFRQGLIWKWIGLNRSSATTRVQGESFSNWIFYRLADVYLMKAEALNQLGKSGNTAQLEESLAIVRKIRERATAPESTDLIPSTSLQIDPQILEEFILKERAREFAHEGKRWFDVLRNAKRDNYAGINHLIVLATYSTTPDKVLGLQNKWKGDFNSHYSPIDLEELRANSALVQNPFYLK
ncbi:MAG: RagB/SusD family nutrient uptake outer membrane protein [Porphyromonadaceae bacterium]|nr:RagB/SusD family nutrient uptake outer membrane protein [Porphyromonadaceae bacterium]